MIDLTDNKQIFSRWAETSTGMLEPFVRLNQLTLQTMERMAELQIKAGQEYIELQKQQLERLGKTQALSDFVAHQEKLADDFAGVLRRNLEKLQEIGGNTQQAFTDWAQDVAEKAVSKAGENLREFTTNAGETMHVAADKAHKATRTATDEARRATAGK